MERSENKKQIRSKRMKKTYMFARICQKLILTIIDGKEVFKLDQLNDEERDFINKEWTTGCNL